VVLRLELRLELVQGAEAVVRLQGLAEQVQEAVQDAGLGVLVGVGERRADG
jgi:hypothetical protein